MSRPQAVAIRVFIHVQESGQSSSEVIEAIRDAMRDVNSDLGKRHNVYLADAGAWPDLVDVDISSREHLPVGSWDVLIGVFSDPIAELPERERSAVSKAFQALGRFGLPWTVVYNYRGYSASAPSRETEKQLVKTHIVSGTEELRKHVASELEDVVHAYRTEHIKKWNVTWIDERSGKTKRFEGVSVREIFAEVIPLLKPMWEATLDIPDVRDASGRERRFHLYPRVALVEALINFLAHRDYSADEYAEIRVRTDRIEFRNPGASRYSKYELLDPGSRLEQPRNPCLLKALRHVADAAFASEMPGTEERGIIKIQRSLLLNRSLQHGGQAAVEIDSGHDSGSFQITIWARSAVNPIRSSASRIFVSRIFISYCEADREWVERELLPRLERAGIEYIEEHELPPGRPRLEAIEQAIKDSRWTLLIVSPRYIKERWKQFDGLLTVSYSLEVGKWRAIPVIVQQCELPTRLKMLVPVHLKEGDRGEWERLIGTLRGEQGEELKPRMAVPETVLVPEGEFWMGDYKHGNERPPHKVLLPTYRIGKYPVTNAQYRDFVRDSNHPPPPHWEGDDFAAGRDDHPVVNVTLEDAEAYCRWLRKLSGQLYRLPTEEEWEKAARGLCPDRRQYPWGDEAMVEWCNTIESNRGGTTPVTRFEEHNKSWCGAVDMAGNVWEWTTSWYQPYPGSDYQGAHFGHRYRVVRGGSWRSEIEAARVSRRGRYKEEARRPYLGFRFAMDP